MTADQLEALEFMKAMRDEFKEYEFQVITPIAVITSKNYRAEKPGRWINPQVTRKNEPKK